MLPGVDFGGVEDRAETGGDGAADQRRAIERHLVADLHQGVLVDEHHLGEGREAQELVDRGAIPGEAWRLVVLPLQPLPVAEDRPPGEAVLAVTAEDREAADDVVARFDMGDVGADRLDDPGGLVARHGRGVVAVLAFHEVEIAVAEPGGDGAHQHLARTRPVDLDLGDLQHGGDLRQNGGAHGLLLRLDDELTTGQRPTRHAGGDHSRRVTRRAHHELRGSGFC